MHDRDMLYSVRFWHAFFLKVIIDFLPLQEEMTQKKKKKTVENFNHVLRKKKKIPTLLFLKNVYIKIGMGKEILMEVLFMGRNIALI